jgi:hypothetical protein
VHAAAAAAAAAATRHARAVADASIHGMGAWRFSLFNQVQQYQGQAQNFGISISA